MEEKIITQELMGEFVRYLIREEKATATCEKYLRDVRKFAEFLHGETVTKERVMQWKRELVEGGYGVRSVNSMLASVNSLFGFRGWHECRVKNIRIQRQLYSAEDRELTREEYLRLLKASENNKQLNLVLQTICATGIRVSELQYFTVEAVRCGEITVNCKGKTRTILIPRQLTRYLLRYAREKHISCGPVFRTGRGKPMDRSTIWRQMKGLCLLAGVKATKVFPHNLRKLFARTFYSLEKDIAKLADVLGHSSINTTRIYIMTTGVEHRQTIERLGLLG